MALNESRRQKLQKQKSRQQVKHTKLYSDPSQALKDSVVVVVESSRFSAEGTILSASW